MKHVFLNLRALVRREKFIFLILLLCVFVSSMVLNFSYGLYYNYEREKQQNIVEYRELWLEINKEQAPTHRQVQDFVEALSPETTENVFFFISGTLSYYASEHSAISKIVLRMWMDNMACRQSCVKMWKKNSYLAA